MKRKGYTNFEILLVLMLSLVLLDIKLDLYNKLMNDFNSNSLNTVYNSEIREAMDYILLTRINNGSAEINTDIISKNGNKININNAECGYDIKIILDNNVELFINSCNITSFSNNKFELIR